MRAGAAALFPLLALGVVLQSGCMSYRQAFEERASQGDPTANRATRKLACDTMREKAQREGEHPEKTRKAMRRMECPFIPAFGAFGAGIAADRGVPQNGQGTSGIGGRVP